MGFGCTGYELESLVVYNRLYEACFLEVMSLKDTIGYYDMNATVTMKSKTGWIQNGEKIGTVTMNLDYYGGEDLYSDGRWRSSFYRLLRITGNPKNFRTLS